MLTVQEISDRLEIEDVIAHYADCIDKRDFDGLREVFAEDAHIDYSAFGGGVGDREATIAYLKGAMRAFKSFQHLNGKSRIKLDGDTASASTQCLNPLVIPVDPASPAVAWCALWYHDKLVRTDAGWRIAERVEEAVMFEGLPAGFAEWMAGQG